MICQHRILADHFEHAADARETACLHPRVAIERVDHVPLPNRPSRSDDVCERLLRVVLLEEDQLKIRRSQSVLQLRPELEDRHLRAWAAEYGPKGVRVNAVSPGPTRTEGTAAMGDALQQLAAQAPAGRPAAPEEIAEAILFLARPTAPVSSRV